MHFIIKYIKYLLNLSPASSLDRFAYIHKTNQKKSDFDKSIYEKESIYEKYQQFRAICAVCNLSAPCHQ